MQVLKLIALFLFSLLNLSSHRAFELPDGYLQPIDIFS